VKNPGPEEPALVSLQRGGVYLETSNEMMESWNNGILGFKNGTYLDFNLYFTSCIEKRFHPFEPIKALKLHSVPNLPI